MCSGLAAAGPREALIPSRLLGHSRVHSFRKCKGSLRAAQPKDSPPQGRQRVLKAVGVARQVLTRTRCSVRVWREAAPPGEKLGWASPCSPVPVLGHWGAVASLRGSEALHPAWWQRRGCAAMSGWVQSFPMAQPRGGLEEGRKALWEHDGSQAAPAGPGPRRVSQGSGEKHPQHPAVG